MRKEFIKKRTKGYNLSHQEVETLFRMFYRIPEYLIRTSFKVKGKWERTLENVRREKMI